jgi:hypothetical protein
MTTSTNKPKTLDKKKEIKKDGKHITRFAPFDAIILYPSLGCPSLVKIEENGDA